MLTLDPATTVVAGDWHGNTRHAVAAVRHAREQLGARTLVHLGDFAYLFAPDFVHDLHAQLRESGVELLFLRGNHDATPVLRGLDPRRERRLGDAAGEEPWPLTEDGRISYLPDGMRLGIGEETALVLGGAGSIDRGSRLPGAEWWPDERIDEALVEEILEEGVGSRGADVLLCHDAPAGVELDLDPSFGAWFAARDEGVLAWCEEHRERLGRVADALSPRLILHGHHHRLVTATRSGRERDALSLGLGLDGETMEENLLVFPLPD